ncbi:MAG: GTPase domain-containing protein [Acidobacteriota bacterium]|jgi:hypothetical protein
MVFFNWATMQMAAKIVYYGPGLCGKTTNLSYIYAKTAPGSRGEMVSLETETDRTLFFDLLPLEVGKVGGFRTRLQLYTVPGQVFYNTTRKLVLKGVDGVVFVADSQRPMADANVESLHNLQENLAELGLDIATIPLVLQYNKRDLRNILSIEELENALNPQRTLPAFEAIAVQGDGVFETLKAITKLTLKNLRRRMAVQESGKVVQPAPERAVPVVSFDPAALSAAAAQGLEQEHFAEPPEPPAAAQVQVTAPPLAEIPAATGAIGGEAAAAPRVVTPAEFPHRAESVAEAVEVLPEAQEVVAAAEPPQAEEVLEEAVEEEAPPEVEFATTPDMAPPAAPEMRHVKVASSLDILAELENVRKASTSRPEPRAAAQPSLDLDALLRTSLNSRRDVKRRVEENVGRALAKASACRVTIQLLGSEGKTVGELQPIDVDLSGGEPLRQVTLTLNVFLRGE